MTSVEEHLASAICDRDADVVRSMLADRSLVVIGISCDSDEADEEPSTLRAEIDGFEALVAFTTQANASAFVKKMDDLFDEDDEVEGLWVDGEALFELLAEGLGLLLNPELDSAAIIDPELAKAIVS